MFSQAWSIYKTSFRTVYIRLMDFIKIWILTSVITLIFLSLLLRSFAEKAFTDFVGGDPNAPLDAGGFLPLVGALFALFVFSGLCVNTHRYIILDERDLSWVPFKFKWGITFGYFWRNFVIALVGGLVFLLFSRISIMVLMGVLGMFYDAGFGEGAVSGFGSFLFWLILVFAVLISGLIACRMFMASVSKAVDQPLDLFETFKYTKNESRLFFVLLLLCFPILAAIEMAIVSLGHSLSIASESGERILFAILFYIVIAFHLFIIMVFITLFSKVYQQYYFKK